MSSMAFDGEAPETDDEEDFCEKIAEIKNNDSEKPGTSNTKSSTDKKLEKRWTQAATEVVNISQKRFANQEKTMQKVTESAAECFTSMQNVAAKLNVVHTNVARLEDSVADLLEASQLIPQKFHTFQLSIPEFL